MDLPRDKRDDIGVETIGPLRVVISLGQLASLLFRDANPITDVQGGDEIGGGDGEYSDDGVKGDDEKLESEEGQFKEELAKMKGEEQPPTNGAKAIETKVLEPQSAPVHHILPFKVQGQESRQQSRRTHSYSVVIKRVVTQSIGD